jgi:Fe-S cluster assembly ATP-binding protein
MALVITNLQVRVGRKTVLNGVSLVVKPGEVVVIMGPNGSGKSSLAYSLMGYPRYKIKSGKIEMDGEDLLGKKADERAKQGLFLGWQSPAGVRGVSVEQLLRAAVINCQNVACKRTGQEERCLTVGEFRKVLGQEAKKLKIKESLLSREINVGFSGGEKKKLEVLQMARKKS